MSAVKSDVLRFYVGVILTFFVSKLVYDLVFSTLQEAEQIALNENISSDKKNTTPNFHGGQLGLKTWVLKKVARRLAKTVLYKKAQQIALTASFGSVVAFMRLIGSYDWWAVYLSDAVVTLTAEDRIILSSLRRMRLGLPMGVVCVPVMYDMQRIVHEGELKQAVDEWLAILTDYDKLSERSPKKNGYFACIVLFVTSALAKHPGFIMLLLRYLQVLCITGKISYNTYLEILWQILLESEKEKVLDRKVIVDFIIKNLFTD